MVISCGGAATRPLAVKRRPRSLTCPIVEFLDMMSAFMMGRWDENCCARTDRLLVTERASRANLLSPVFVTSSSSIGCLSAVMSLNVSRNKTTTSFSFFIGAICSRSHSGVPAMKHESVNASRPH